MSDFLQSLIALVTLSIVIAILNAPIRRLLKRIFCGKRANLLALKFLIFVAEHKRAFKPPGSGPQKKEWVKQKYDKWVEKDDMVIDECIDFIVSALNSRKSSYKSTAKTQLSSVTKDVFDSTFDAIEKAAESTNDGNETELTDSSDTNAEAVG